MNREDIINLIKQWDKCAVIEHETHGYGGDWRRGVIYRRCANDLRELITRNNNDR